MKFKWEGDKKKKINSGFVTVLWGADDGSLE